MAKFCPTTHTLFKARITSDSVTSLAFVLDQYLDEITALMISAIFILRGLSVWLIYRWVTTHQEVTFPLLELLLIIIVRRLCTGVYHHFTHLLIVLLLWLKRLLHLSVRCTLCGTLHYLSAHHLKEIQLLSLRKCRCHYSMTVIIHSIYGLDRPLTSETQKHSLWLIFELLYIFGVRLLRLHHELHCLVIQAPMMFVDFTRRKLSFDVLVMRSWGNYLLHSICRVAFKEGSYLTGLWWWGGSAAVLDKIVTLLIRVQILLLLLIRMLWSLLLDKIQSCWCW